MIYQQFLRHNKMHVHMLKLLLSSVHSTESSSIHDASDYLQKSELLKNAIYFNGTVVTHSFPSRAPDIHYLSSKHSIAEFVRSSLLMNH